MANPTGANLTYNNQDGSYPVETTIRLNPSGDVISDSGQGAQTYIPAADDATAWDFLSDEDWSDTYGGDPNTVTDLDKYMIDQARANNDNKQLQADTPAGSLFDSAGFLDSISTWVSSTAASVEDKFDDVVSDVKTGAAGIGIFAVVAAVAVGIYFFSKKE